MKLRWVTVCLAPLAIAALVSAAPETQPAPVQTQPAAETLWTADYFKYERPDKLIVEESTPTPAQLSFRARPPQEQPDAAPPRETPATKPALVSGINIIHLRFRDALGQNVPAILCTPADKAGPFPLVIGAHGLTSHKEQLLGQIGPTLAAKGFAILAFDLPSHGERPGNPADLVANAKEHGGAPNFFRDSVIDVRQLIDFAETRPELNVKSGVYLVGYSLGSWVVALAGPVDPRVKAMILMVAGRPETPAPETQDAIAIDPSLSLQHFTPRPILMLNGRTDKIVKPESATHLFGILPEPKQQIWYDSGHLLPPEAYEQAAEWLAKKEQP